MFEYRQWSRCYSDKHSLTIKKVARSYSLQICGSPYNQNNMWMAILKFSLK